MKKGRKKDNMKWWRGVERYLRRENEIRAAVKEGLAEMSYIKAASIRHEGNGGRKVDRVSDFVIKRGKELPAVVLEDGETIRRPESWLSCFDSVRRMAAQCRRPEWIFDAWRERYTNGARGVYELIGGRLERGCCVEGYDSHGIILWIIESVERAAVQCGLLLESDCLLYGRPPAAYLETCPPQRLD